MFDTVGNITTDVLHELTLVSGTSVQTYTEPMIVSGINKGFQFLFKKRFWTHLTETTQHLVDANSGLIVDASIAIESIDDVQWVRKEPFEKRDALRYLDGEEWFDWMEESYESLSWNNPLYKTKLLRIYPFNINVPIRIRARRMPPRFASADDVVPFDNVCITHLVTANMLANDGVNPLGMQTQYGLFDQRYKDLLAAESGKVSYFGRGGEIETFTVAGT